LRISGDPPKERAIDKSVSDEELTSFCREKLAGFNTPKRFTRVGEPLPRTPTGKVTKFVLVEKYSDPT
jgi:acyl-CoA synthetase (AMP-forming)/AMP-acid ligase II